MDRPGKNGISFGMIDQEAFRKAVLEDKLTVDEAALKLGLSKRQIYIYAMKLGLSFYHRTGKNSKENIELLKQGLCLCSKCKEIKAYTSDNFDIAVKSARNTSTVCKSCSNIKHARVRDTLYGRFDSLFFSARKRAEMYGHAFELSKQDIVDLYFDQNRRCYYTGIVLSSRSNNRETSSLDRLDSSIGYIKGNVVLCCTIVNKMKLDMSVEEFRTWCRRVVFPGFTEEKIPEEILNNPSEPIDLAEAMKDPGYAYLVSLSPSLDLTMKSACVIPDPDFD